MKKLIIPVLALMCIFAFTACGQLADPIALPDAGIIDSIDITTFDGSVISITDLEQIEQCLTALSQAEPTRKDSIQDAPLAAVFGKIDISNEGRTTTIFYYTENGQSYIEQPYQGIYKTDADFDALAHE